MPKNGAALLLLLASVASLRPACGVRVQSAHQRDRAAFADVQAESHELAGEGPPRSLASVLAATRSFLRNETRGLLAAVLNQTGSELGQSIQDVKGFLTDAREAAQRSSSELLGDVRDLKEQLREVVPAKKAEIALQLELKRAQLQKVRRRLSEGLFGAGAVAAANVSEQQLQELLFAAQNASGAQQAQVMRAAEQLRERLRGMRNASEQKGAAFAATVANATGIIAERVGELVLACKNATANVKLEAAQLQEELQRLLLAVRTRGQELGESALDAAAAVGEAAGELAERLSAMPNKGAGQKNEARAAVKRQKLQDLAARRLAANSSCADWARSAAASLEVIRQGVLAQEGDVRETLGGAAADKLVELQAQAKQLRDQAGALKAASGNISSEARAFFQLLATNSSVAVGQLKAQVQMAVGKRKEELQAQLADARLRLETLREAAGAARAAASAEIAAVARATSERLGALRAQLLNATNDTRASLEAEVAKHSERLQGIWAANEAYTAPAEALIRSETDGLLTSSSTAGDPPTARPPTTTAAPPSSFWSFFRPSWLFGPPKQEPAPVTPEQEGEGEGGEATTTTAAPSGWSWLNPKWVMEKLR